MNSFLRTAFLFALAVAAPIACSSGEKPDKPDLATGQVRQPLACTIDDDCTDTSVCTTDKCVASVCQNTRVAGCCEADADCNDNVSCTVDHCDTPNFACVHDK